MGKRKIGFFTSYIDFFISLRLNYILSKVGIGSDLHEELYKNLNHDENDKAIIPDLSRWPRELSFNVLSRLDATDLCLAACVWEQLACDNILWRRLCQKTWNYLPLYEENQVSYRKLYLMLDEATLTFNSDAFEGLGYLVEHGILHEDPKEIALFILNTKCLCPYQVRRLVDKRPSTLDYIISLQDYHEVFLPTALRKLFQIIEIESSGDNCLERLLELFSWRYWQCNCNLGLSPDHIYILCFSLVILSIDLSSPNIKNKMSKREFIRNIRHAVIGVDDDLSGHLYDNIYLNGHVVGKGVNWR